MIERTNARLEVAADADGLAVSAANLLLAAARDRQGKVAIALSGGSTPRRLYELLTLPPYREAFPWDRVHWFWGDERFVPRNDPASNYHMVETAMLSRAPVPAENIHPVPTEGLEPAAAALAYEAELQRFYGAARLEAGRPLFDVNLLGLGADGHTASLFPGTSALEERERWAVAVIGAQPQVRITLTYPVLESSRETVFLVEGAGKREMLGRLRRGDETLPAARLRPTGRLWFLADAAAVG